MLHLQKRILAVLAACVTTGSLATPSQATVGANPALGKDVSAVLTSKHGMVFKRDFRDWNREEWGAPAPAEVSDQLHEGMQIGTGNDSWAEVTWPNVKTRAWSNTVFAVAPNKRLVYLTGGEMLFRLDKHRKDKDDYYIWTKVLQARIRGTTVLVQAKGPVTRFTVMEGVVEVTNRLDKSRATLRPGSVWEIKGYNLKKVNDNDRPTPMVVPKNFDSSINEITYDPDNGLPVFQDKYATSTVFASNKDALLNHPLLNAGGPIDSMQLIQDAQRDLPGYNKLLPIKLADSNRLNKVISSSVELTAVPSKANYGIGQSIGKGIKLPAAAYGDLQPESVLLNPATIRARSQAAQTALAAPRMAPPMVPIIIAPLVNAPEEQAKDTAAEAAKVFNEDPQPYPQMRNDGAMIDPIQGTAVPSVLPNTCLTPSGSAPILTNSAFQPMPNAIPNPVPTINGVLPAAGAALPGMNTVTSSTGAVINPVGAAINPLAAPVNTLLPLNTVRNTVNGLTNTLNIGH